MLQLPRTVPFVDAVFRASEHPRDHAALRAAVDLLWKAENESGITIVCAPVCFNTGSLLVVKPGMEPPTFSQILRMVGSELTQSFDFDVEGFDDFTAPDGPIGRFLDKTHLLLTGEDMCGILEAQFVTTEPRISGQMSWRTWGAVAADWTNARFGHRSDNRAWKYLDFYMREYTQPWIAAYYAWSDAARHVVQIHNEELMKREGLFS